MIVLAALVGGLAPFCSCEVIPFIAALLALGTPVSAVMAFWLSSPLIDPAAFLITAGALGWPFAIGKTAAAVGVGLMGGFAMQAAVRAGFFANPGEAPRIGRLLRRRRRLSGARPNGASGAMRTAGGSSPTRRRKTRSSCSNG